MITVLKNDRGFCIHIFFTLFLLLSCSQRNNAGEGSSQPVGGEPQPAGVSASGAATGVEGGLILTNVLERILGLAEIPGDITAEILDAAHEGPGFILDLLSCLDGDPYLRVLVDKNHALPGDYAPQDLVTLSGGSYLVSRNGLLLRRAAAESLEEMAAAALAEGIRLTASSCYRTYDYQRDVYARIVRELGQAEADRVSAPPGHSQHQLGLVVDFGSIDDSFAETPQGRWMAVNAGRFGWSLSYPRDYEALTGYRWESWHYRYVGRDLASFIETYFRGIQQYALRFIYEWEKAGGL